MADRTEKAYVPCDKAIKAMNRENLKAFGRLKVAKWDELSVIRTVAAVYRESAERARKRYHGIAWEVYLMVLDWCHVDPKKAREMAEKAITWDWVDDVLEETDFVTLYRFNTETDRKAQRLTEALAGTSNRNFEIDKALRFWSMQLGQYAINFTDYAALQAFKDAGIEVVEWISQKDQRVCTECHALDGQLFRVDEVPRKPHWGCRCFWKAVFRQEEDHEGKEAKAEA